MSAVNTHDQLRLAGGGVAIMPTYTGTRTQYPYGWGVYRVNEQGKHVITDPNAHWRKVFPHSSGDGATAVERKRTSLKLAMKWVAEQGWYDGEWARNRMRDYVPRDVNKRFPLPKS